MCSYLFLKNHNFSFLIISDFVSGSMTLIDNFLCVANYLCKNTNPIYELMSKIKKNRTRRLAWVNDTLYSKLQISGV